MMRHSPLQQWLDDELGNALLPTLTLPVCAGVAKEISLLAAFGGFAAIADRWITAGLPASSWLIVLVTAALFTSWALQGVSDMLSHMLRTRQLTILEQRLSQQLVTRQHALIRTKPVYHWQLLWQKHLPALVNWRTDYCVQQYIAVIVPLIVLTIIFYLNYFIGIMLLLTLPVVPIFMIIVGKGAAYLHRREFIALTRLGSLFSDRLMALPMLAGVSAHAQQQRQLKRASLSLNKRTMKVISVAFLSSTVLDFFSTLSVALIAVYIGFKLLGELSLGPDVTFLSGLWILLSAPLLLSQLKKLGQFYHQKAHAEAASEALTDLLRPVVKLTPKTSHFNGLTVTNFEMESPVLQGSVLTVQPNDWIQVTGASGSGKSALLEALAGCRNASHEIECATVMMGQHPVFLPGTLRDNLCLGHAYTDAQLCSKLDDVGMLEDIQALPVGLDTPLGDAPAFSGGQLQRLALVRLLLQDASVWMLDEPTAHLPIEQHLQISQLIRQYCLDKTVIWVSHKPLPHDWFTAVWRVADHTISESRGAE